MAREKKDPNGNTFRKPRTNAQVGVVADWASVNPKVLVDCIEIASRKSGALRFGYTRDGGAYAVGVYAGENYFTDYIRPNEDIDQYLTDLIASFEDYDGTADAGPTKRGSKR